jgi:hypothetical protein
MSSRLLSSAFLIIALAGFFVRPVWEDEIEHLHCAYLVSAGEKPYQDFFQNHPPALHWLISPFTRFFPQALSLVFASRCLISIILALTFSLGAALLPSKGGIWYWIALFSAPMYWLSYHMRPDPFMLLFFILHVRSTLKYWRSSHLRSALEAGFFLGCAVVFLPKILPVFVIFPLSGLIARKKLPVKSIAIFLAGFCIPEGLFLLILSRDHILELFFQNVFAQNSELLNPAALIPRLKVLALNLPLVAFWIAGSLANRRSQAFDDRCRLFQAYAAAAMVSFFVSPFGWDYNLAPWVLCVASVSDALVKRIAAIRKRRPSALFYILLAVALEIPPLSSFIYDLMRLPESLWRMKQITFIESRIKRDDPVFAVAPLHPIFARDSAKIYHPWQFYFAQHDGQTRERWFDHLSQSLAAAPPKIIDAGYLSQALVLTPYPEREKYRIENLLSESWYQEQDYEMRKYFIRIEKPDPPAGFQGDW